LPKENIEFPLGIFLISTNPPQDSGSLIDVELQGYDKTIILKRDTLDSFRIIPSDTNIVNECVRILAEMGFTRIRALPNDAVTQRAITFEPATSKLQMINDFLQMINYNVIYFDRHGFAIIEPYQLPTLRRVEIAYDVDSLTSVIEPGLSSGIDLFNIPNKFNVVSMNYESEQVLTATYENRNPLSPVSIDRVGWRNSINYQVTDITSQSVLDDYIRRLAYNYMDKYSYAEFPTQNIPLHDYYNCIHLSYPRLNINAAFMETNWTMKFNGNMTHKARRKMEV